MDGIFSYLKITWHRWRITASKFIQIFLKRLEKYTKILSLHESKQTRVIPAPQYLYLKEKDKQIIPH